MFLEHFKVALQVEQPFRPDSYGFTLTAEAELSACISTKIITRRSNKSWSKIDLNGQSEENVADAVDDGRIHARSASRVSQTLTILSPVRLKETRRRASDSYIQHEISRDRA